jgi:Kef-type K+ transport system membrane component KefB
MTKLINRLKNPAFLALAALFLSATSVFAAEGATNNHAAFALTFGWIAVLLFIAKLSGLVDRFGLPPVLGELIVGVILGNLVLLNIHWFEPLKHSEIITFLAELGVIILLFQSGLESNLTEMRRVGVRASLVAIIGVVVPFLLGAYLAGPWLLPNLSSNSYLFLGAALTATSVGITARVFRDLGKSKIKEAKIVLGAAVIDDVLGLIILAVVSAIVTKGNVNPAEIGLISAKAIGFLVSAILIGQLIAPHLSKLLSKIHDGVGMKFTLAITFALVFSYLASLIGLAPIVGAFAAGLILDPVHFKAFKDPEIVTELREVANDVSEKAKDKIISTIRHHSDHHLEEIIQPIGLLLVPIFFVVTGLQVKLETLANPSILLTALAITLVAVGGKVIAGTAAGNVNKWVVGWGMVPRGEVGLIFANVGKALGVVGDEAFSVIVIMIILTTLLTPPILTFLLKQQSQQASAKPDSIPTAVPSTL